MSSNVNITTVYNFSVKNTGSSQDTFKVTATPDGPDFQLNYFDAGTGGNDITNQITSSSGYITTPLAVGIGKGFRVEVTPSAAIANSSVLVNVSARSATNSSPSDTAKAVTNVNDKGQPDLRIRLEESATFIGDTIINQTGQDQTVSKTVNPNVAANYIFSVKNVGMNAGKFKVFANLGGPKCVVRYFDRTTTGEIDVTTQITSDNGYLTASIEAGSATGFRAEVKPTVDLVGSFKTVTINAQAANGVVSPDIVKANTYAINSGIPDLRVRAAMESTEAWVGDDIINTTAENQTITRPVLKNETIAYVFQVKNTAQKTGAFKINGISGGQMWSVHYFNDSLAGDDITAQITGTGYTTPALVSGANSKFRVEVTPIGATLTPGQTKSIDITATPVVGSPPPDMIPADTIRVNTQLTDLEAPQNVFAISSGSGKITLYWDKVAGANSYCVYRSTSSGSQDYSSPIPNSDSLSDPSYSGSPVYMFTDVGLANSTEYFYTVKAFKSGGMSSSASDEDSNIVDPNAIPWDSRNPTQILAVAAQLANISSSEEQIAPSERLLIMAPDGAYYDRSSSGQQIPCGQFNQNGEFVLNDGTRIAVSNRDGTDAPVTDGRTNYGIPGPLTGANQGAYRGSVTNPGYRESGYDVTLGPIDLTGRSKGWVDTAYVCLGSDVGAGTGGQYAASNNVDAGLINQMTTTTLWKPYLLISNSKGSSVLYGGPNRILTTIGPGTFQPGAKIHLHYWLAITSDFSPAGTKSKKNCVFLRAYDKSRGHSISFGGPAREHNQSGAKVRLYRFQQLAQLRPSGKTGNYFHSGSFMKTFNWENGKLKTKNEQSYHAWGQRSSDLFSHPKYGNPVSHPESLVTVGSYIDAANEKNVSIILPNDGGVGP